MPPSVVQNVPLASRTTLGVGGSAEYFAEVRESSELRAVLVWAREKGLPVTVLGGGSNVLIADAGIPGLVVCPKLLGISYAAQSPESVIVTAGAGEDWDELVHSVTGRGLWGIENLSGIPGTVGAAPVQNINAYGASVADVTMRVSGLTLSGEPFSFTQSECRFGYRDSIFKVEEGRDHIITEVVFRLTRTRHAETSYRSSSQSIARYLTERGIEAPVPGDVREAVLRARKNIGMLSGMFRSAGSFFKNTVVSAGEFQRVLRTVSERHAEKGEKLAPWHWDLPDGTVKISTAFLMECTPYNKTDFRDRTWNGAVGISPLHTLSLVNAGGATAKDIADFSDEIVRAVREEFSVRIEPEVCRLP